ncbi:MAG: hypothetical protein K0R26_2715 [Bacteroidota bacterium]|jgi:hypothetical protein|nr:hypothetical protein [Bacteroidota bacterium]
MLQAAVILGKGPTFKTSGSSLIRELMDLQEVIYKEKVPIDIEYHGVRYEGEAKPIHASCRDGICGEFEVTLNGAFFGIMNSTMSGWVMQGEMEQDFVDQIGDEIHLWFDTF